MKLFGVLTALLPLLAAVSCSKAPDDPLCRYDPLPPSSGVPAGQGGVQIMDRL